MVRLNKKCSIAETVCYQEISHRLICQLRSTALPTTFLILSGISHVRNKTTFRIVRHTNGNDAIPKGTFYKQEDALKNLQAVTVDVRFLSLASIPSCRSFHSETAHKMFYLRDKKKVVSVSE